MLKNENIICVSTMNWDFLWTRKQRFMDMLAKKGNRILYVEPTFSVAAKVRQGGTSLKVGFWPRLSQVRGNLYVLTPSLMFPFARFKCIRDINQRIFIWQVRWAQKKLNLRRPILWTYVPVYHKLAGKFFEKLFIYDCVDEHSAYPAAKKELLKVLEEKIIKTADVVFVTSWRLYEKKKLLNKNTFYVPNGVDFEFFRDVLTNKRVPKDMMAIKGPVIGWIGGVRSWLDFDLIEYIAETNPQWSIVFVGPVTEKVNLEPLQKLKNVFFLGEKAKEEIPVYLQNFDVCLIHSGKNKEKGQKLKPLVDYFITHNDSSIKNYYEAFKKMPKMKVYEKIIFINGNYEIDAKELEKKFQKTTQNKDFNNFELICIKNKELINLLKKWSK